jgi:hypothetical protein
LKVAWNQERLFLLVVEEKVQSSLFGQESEDLVVRRLARRLDRHLKTWEGEAQKDDAPTIRNLTPPAKPKIPKLSLVPPAPPSIPSFENNITNETSTPPPLPVSVSAKTPDMPEMPIQLEVHSKAIEKAQVFVTEVSEKSVSASVEIPEMASLRNSPPESAPSSFALPQEPQKAKHTRPPVVALPSESLSVAESIAHEKIQELNRKPNVETGTILGMRPVFAYVIVFIAAVLVILYFVLVSDHFAY